jgi:hypothetical protein
MLLDHKEHLIFVLAVQMPTTVQTHVFTMKVPAFWFHGFILSLYLATALLCGPNKLKNGPTLNRFRLDAGQRRFLAMFFAAISPKP